MFKIESYITPLLMGYVDKYVKLRPEDFQLSLWGGDVVLNNLDLRLDIIERAMQLPIMFKSGHIHELRIHVPWTKLGSEPVVITINTIECILKLRDKTYEDSRKSKSKDIRKSRSSNQVKPRRPEGEDLPPGYLQSLMNKITNNVSVIVNNLIIKFVEDDIVLSLNVKSAECYSVDGVWNRAFTELSAPEFILRKSVNFCDLTVCLDKCDSSGRIETYQDPLIYRCSITGRMYIKYDSVHAKLPSITKLDLFCDKLDVSLTDTQLPMFIRLIELCIALYYGSLEFPSGPDTKSTDGDAQQEEHKSEEDLEAVPTMQPESDDKGWAEWAWSYVPQILPTEEGELEEGPATPKKKTSPMLSLGMFAHMASITFKLTEVLKDKHQFGPKKIAFRPFLSLEGEGISMEMLLRGLDFFNIKVGFTCCQLLSQGSCICGAKDEGDVRSEVLLQGGETLQSKSVLNYYSQSLFDLGCPANQNADFQFVFDTEEHLRVYSEQYATQRFGVFYLDYIYTMPGSDEQTKPESSKSSVTSETDDCVVFVNENSIIRYIVGSCHLNVSSSAVHRITKIISCAKDHSYEPYTKFRPEVVDDGRPHPTEDQVRSLEKCIPVNTHHLILIQPSATVFYAEHASCDMKKKNYHTTQRSHKTKEDPSKQSQTSLPCVSIAADRFDLQSPWAMYPRKLVQIVSKTIGPSPNLLHHCYSHTQMKLFGFSAGLVQLDKAGSKSPQITVIPPCSGALYIKKLLMPMYWKSAHLPKIEQLLQVPQLSVNVTKASLLLGLKIWSSWQQQSPKPSSLQDNSLVDDVFQTDKSSGDGVISIPVMEMSLSGCEVKKCRTATATAYSGTLTSVQVIMYDVNHTKPLPLLYAPANTSRLYSTDVFLSSTPIPGDKDDDFLVFTYQIPRTHEVTDVPSVLLMNMEGVVCLLDPVMVEWFLYNPREKVKLSRQGREKVMVDETLAQAAMPLRLNDSQVSLASSGSVTPNTESLSQTQTDTPTVTQSRSTAHLPTAQEGEKVKERTDISEKLAAMFPFIRMLQVQVEVKSCCVFVNKYALSVPDPSVYIPQNYVSALQQGAIPGTMVISLPHIHVVSSGVKPVHALQDIPIQTMEASLVGEKLPWTVNVDNFSIYTMMSKTEIFYVLKPVSVNCTVAVSTKYSPPTSDAISALGLCLHTDMRSVAVSCSQPQVQLCVSTAVWLGTLMEQVVTFSKDLSRSLNVKDKLTPITQEPQKTPSLYKGQPSMTSITEDVEQTETGTSGELTSRDTTPIRDLLMEDADADGVKLSLWLQWTLPKFEIRFYRQHDLTEKDTKVSIVMEDLTTSVDVEVIYAKVKVTCGGCVIHHFIRNQDRAKSTWTKGSNLGILMSSQKDLSRDIHVVSNKIWSNDSPVGESSAREVNRRFINLTFTRALCKNVKQRMRKVNADLMGIPDVGNEAGNELYFHKYISEICLSMQPCDFVFNIPALVTVADCFRLSGVKKSGSQPKNKVSKTVAKETPSLPWFTSSLLPLLYVDMASSRVFMPVKHSGDHDPKSQPESDDKVKSTIDHDLLIGLVHSINITPQADNPLPRYASEKELYCRAMQYGIDRIPGSAVENRQYQMEVKGLSLCTGRWCDFVDRQKSEEKTEMNTPTIQIPALEWNTILNSQKENVDIQLVPLVASLDMKVVAAPAIVYTPQDVSQPPILVCGHTVELNASSDIDFFISTNQIHLIENWISQSKAVLLLPMDRKSEEDAEKFDEVKFDRVTSDSGLGSDNSALTLGKGISPVPTQHPTTQEQRSMFLTPFDLLLTAGRISCTMYTHKILDEDIRPGVEGNRTVGPKSAQNGADNISMNSEENNSELEIIHKSERSGSAYSFMNIHASASERKKVIQSGSSVIQPFLYLYFSQPHTVLKCHHAEQTFEMSCYDILMKGPATNYIESGDKKVIPDCSDFCRYWIETRAGNPNPKTGIPPSLYTLRVNNFLKETALIDLKVERPLKVNVSEEKLLQVKQFMADLFPVNTNKTEASLTPEKVKKTRGQGQQMDVGQVIVSKLERVTLHTEQIVVSMETGKEFKNSGVIGSVDGVRIEIGLDQPSGVLDSMEAYVRLKDVQLKTIYQNNSRPLIGPCSVTVDAILEKYKSSDRLSRISTRSATITTSLVTVFIGQEHVMCFNCLQEQLQKILKTNSKTKTKSADCDKEVKLTVQGDFIVERTGDDLRSGQFQYIQNPDPNIDIGTGEITFCSRDSDGDSSMTWCYDEPRVISHVSFMPIPFNVPDNTRGQETSEMLLPSTLFYQDTVTQQFLPYVDFELSENTQTILQVPEVKVINAREIVVAQTWRVVIHNNMFQSRHDDRDPPQEGATAEDDLAIFPESLAASMCVDSCYVPSLIPAVQVYLSVPAIEICLRNHMAYLGKDVPDKLQPFAFDGSSLDDQEFAVVSTRQLTLTWSHLTGCHGNTSIQMNATPEVEVVEYKTLTKQTVVRPFDVFADITYTPYSKCPLVETSITVDPVMVNVGRGTVHTLSCATQSWSQMMSKKGDNSRVVCSHYVICNDTHQTIRFGQVGTDENLVLMPRKMHCYSWRTQRSAQRLHMCLDGRVWKWSEPFDIESDGRIVRSVRTSDQIYTFIIYITALTNVQKQIKIRGQLMLFSCLTLPLEVKLSTTSGNVDEDFTLCHNQSLPSFVLEPEEVRSVKLRPLGSHGNWSHDIYITGDRMKENRTVKIHNSDSSYFHIWCRVLCFHYKEAVNTKVLFSPLYVVRSHLPRPVFVNLDTPILKKSQQLEIPGQGRELQLHCAGSDVSHSLTFQLRSKKEDMSSQALTLSTGLIAQVERGVVSKLDELTDSWTVRPPQDWPYCFHASTSDNDNHQSMYSAPSDTNCADSLDVSDVDTANLTMTLNINLSEYWPGSNTLLVNLSPWCLMTNQSDLDLIVMDATGSQWALPHGKTFTPPKFEGEIMLGMRIGHGVVCTGSIPLSDEEVDLQRYRPDLEQVLYLDGHVRTRIAVTQADRVRVYFLTVQSAVRHRMRVITVLESVCITNLTGQPYQALLQCVSPRMGQVRRAPPTSVLRIPDHSRVSKQESDVCPLPWWTCDQSRDSTQLQDEESLVHYMLLQPIKSPGTDESEIESSTDKLSSVWSNPVRLLANRNGVRTTVSVPHQVRGLYTEPICITGQERDGVAYFVMKKDKSPSCLFQNLTGLPVYYGHHNTNISSSGITVQEETEVVGGPPCIPIGQNVFYTPALINGTFGDDIANTRLPSLHIAINSKDLQPSQSSDKSLMQVQGQGQISSEGQTPAEGHMSKEGQGQTLSVRNLVWSRSIDVNSDMEMFVPISGCIDVKVKVRKVAMVTFITVETISKAEVSAKAIRSRLTGQERTVTTVPQEYPADTSLNDSLQSVPKENSMETLKKLNEIFSPRVPKLELSAGVRFRHMTISLKDETTSSEEVSEVLRISMDELFLAYYPSGNVSMDELENAHSCISACVGVIQVDNQLFHSKGLYDFPVLFIPQTIPDPSKLTLPNLQNLSTMEKFAVLKSISFSHVQIVLGTNVLDQSIIRRLEFGIQPLMANIDDGFILRLLKEIEGLIPTNMSHSNKKKFCVLVKKLPRSFQVVSCMHSSPVKVEHLCIQPITLLFSIHASLKLFIASDRTPLAFKKFERKDVCGIMHQVVRVLAMHYATGALFRAGIVVGSLEILGNPTGLVRSIGTGVADLFKMPYTGLTHGPGAFVSGVSHGMTSFVKNISSGMIMSVTSFASSVSRNMDRLSLDHTHLERQEERRRQQPDGISSGLKQGLTGFGMSLLGAVAGLADQPIQNVIASQDTDERPASTAAAATGLVTGVGKGLVGAFTKPIGGAAELVSQTGQGLLQGTGLAGHTPKVRYKADIHTVASFPSSRLKYLGKLLQSLTFHDLLTSTPAAFIDLTGSEVKVELVITNELLFVMNCEEDAQQQAFSLAELEVSLKPENPHLLTLQWKDRSHQPTGESGDGNKDRVEAFIDGAADYVHVSPPGSPSGGESQSDVSASPAGQGGVVPQFHFLLDPSHRDAFITVFRLAKKRHLGQGFAV